MLENELKSKKRLACVREECDILRTVRPAPPNNDPLFLKFKGARKLDPRSLGVLEKVLQLREKLAKKKDRPAFKVFGSSVIIDIATKRPKTEKDLSKIKGLGPRQVKAIGPSILKKVESALKVPDKDLPHFPKTKKKRKANSPGTAARIEILRDWRVAASKVSTIDPSIICTNAQIKVIANAYPQKPSQMAGLDGIRDWQVKMFGKEICEILRKK